MTDKPKIGTIEYAWECIDRMDRPVTGDDEHQGWDDLMEYEPRDFVDRFAVSTEDADILWAVVQARVDNRRVIHDKDRHLVGDMIAEAEHQSYDGWSLRQRLIIEAFVGDIAWAIYQTEHTRRCSAVENQSTTTGE